MKVLVTGATGFIGSAVVKNLLRAGYDVRILVRTKKYQRILNGFDVEIVEGDITSVESVNLVVKGCSVVFDLASLYDFFPFWDQKAEEMYRVNVEGARNLLNASLEHHVERFVYTSTIATIGKRVDGGVSDEATAFDFDAASHYARSKYLAEQEVLKACHKGLNASILNPAIVIGQGDHKPTPSGEIIVKFLNRSYPVYFDTIWSVVDVEDVASAHVAAITRGCPGERYILCEHTHYTMREFFQIIEDVSGIRAPRWRVSYHFLLALVHAEEVLSYKMLGKKPLMPTEGVKFCKSSVIYDNAKAIRELGFQPTPIRSAIARAVRWYEKNGYLKNRLESIDG